MHMKINVTGSLRPTLVRMNGKLFVTPTTNGWLEVPEGTTLDDLIWTPTYVLKPKTVKPKVEKVRSSDGKKVYLVTTYSDGQKTCTCPGYSFRRFCKHTGAKH